MINTKIGDPYAIIEQLGGNRFFAMTGSKANISHTPEGYARVILKLTRNKLKAQYLIVTLNGKDLYDLEFSRIKKTQNPEFKALGVKFYDEEYVILKEFKDVYADMLEEIFKTETGLCTRL